MFDYADTRHSRFVALAKVILPLIALALLSTVFLIARAPGTAGPVPYASGTVEDLAREPRLSSPTYTGVASDGSRIVISAASARPNDGGATIETPAAEIVQPSGTVIEMSAGLGELIEAENLVRLTGLARIVTSSGYAMETIGADTDLTTGRITSHGRVAVQSPEAEITAGLVTFEPGDDTNGPRLLFSDGVVLTYDPKRED